MNIAGIDYNLKLKSLDIFLAGCKGPHCDGCQNQELWDFNIGKPWWDWCDKLKSHIESGMVDNIMVYGGEPLDQDIDTLANLLNWFTELTNKPIWLFTKYDLNKVPIVISKYCRYIKTGEYIRGRNTLAYPEYNITLASDNQKIHYITNPLTNP